MRMVPAITAALLSIACAAPDATTRGVVEIRAAEGLGDLYVDARDRGPAIGVRRIELTPGQHVIELRRDRLVVATRTIEVRGGDALAIDLEDRTAFATDAAVPAQLEIRSEPAAAETRIDGRAEGMTPVQIVVAPGSHHVSVRATGYVDHDEDVVIAPGSSTTIDVVLEPTSP